jgi:ABC-2 type transport system permease protein
MLIPVLAMVRKDLRLFFSDRRAVIVSFAVPIAIASFFGSIFPGARTEPIRIAVAIVDQDGSAISRDLIVSAQADTRLAITQPGLADAREAVRRGATSVAIIVPAGFGQAAGQALLGRGARPALELVYDPSRNLERATARGVLTEHIIQAVSREVLGTRAPVTPYTVREQALTAGNNGAYNGYAHSFAGMGIQFLLFATANLGIEILLERQRGLWRRLRSAPVSRFALLASRAASMTVIALMTLFVSFGFAMIVFGVRIQGSVVGFLGVALASAVMAATFGLLVASVGGTPAATRGVTTLAVLMMVMLGGAWVPTFVFPSWLQQLTLIVPARWAVDGLDAMTWRGLDVSGAIVPTLVLLAFAAVFGAVALARFRWEET